MRLCALWLNIVSHHLLEFGNHELCENRDITAFTRHVTIVSCDHRGWWPLPINKTHFKFNRHDLAKVEIQRFLFVTWPHVTTWIKEHVTLKFVASYHNLPSCLVWWPQISWKWSYSVFCLSCDLKCPRDQRVMWLCG